MTKNEILEGLNEEQKEAVINYIGPSYILAGPGAGKTKSLVSRTQYMITEGVNPKEILLFTFTNKAAKEIKERISLALGKETAEQITSGTYHSICNKLLRQYGYVLGYTRFFSILDSEDSKSILSKLVKGTLIDSKALASYISKQKRNNITYKEALRNSEINNKENLAIYYAQYQKYLKKNNSMDFDDLVFNTVYLLRNYPEIKQVVNDKYKYITADESHDSSVLDMDLIELLSGENKNVCFILDFNQSIYSFRGANIDAVINARKRYKDIVVYNLSRNYRCTKTIVEASNSLIDHNPLIIERNIFTKNADGNKIIVIKTKNQIEEAINIANIVKLMTNKYELDYKDIAILYRTNMISKEIEKIFIKNQIPYNLISSINFFSRSEIKDLISYLNFVNNGNNFEAFTRIVNVPKRGIGNASIDKIKDIFENEDISILDACKKVELKGKAKKGISDFVKTIESFNNEMKAKDFFETLIEDLKYVDFLKQKDKDDEIVNNRVENIETLINLSEDYNLIDFSEEVSLNTRIEDDEDDNKVNMLTMHLSKGLEFKCVIIAGAADGIIPHQNSLGSLKAIEEERRLMYVAMTRAKEYLFMTYSKSINQNGWFRKLDESRFIDEIDKKYLYIKE